MPKTPIALFIYHNRFHSYRTFFFQGGFIDFANGAVECAGLIGSSGAAWSSGRCCRPAAHEQPQDVPGETAAALLGYCSCKKLGKSGQKSRSREERELECKIGNSVQETARFWAQTYANAPGERDPAMFKKFNQLMEMGGSKVTKVTEKLSLTQYFPKKWGICSGFRFVGIELFQLGYNESYWQHIFLIFYSLTF